jgi:hypothetical protein
MKWPLAPSTRTAAVMTGPRDGSVGVGERAAKATKSPFPENRVPSAGERFGNALRLRIRR